MIVLALDIATRTGVSVGSSGKAPVSWSVDLGKGRSEGARFSKALSLTHCLIRDHSPDLIAVEAAIGGPNTSHFLVGLLACVRGVSENRGVPVEVCSIGSIRKHFLGKQLTVRDYPGLSKAQARKQIKSEVMKRCSLLGWETPDDDAADAAACFDYACSTFARGYQAKPVGGLFK